MMSTEQTELMQTPLLKIWVPGAGGSLSQRIVCECGTKYFHLLHFVVVVFGLSLLLVYGRFHISSNKLLLIFFYSCFSILDNLPACR